MREHEIDDHGLTATDQTDPAALQHADATHCAECEGIGALRSGETCPVCEGTGKPTGRTGGG